MTRLYLFAVLICLLCACSTSRFSKKDVKSAQKLYGLEFTDEYVDVMHEYLGRNLRGYDSLRTYDIPHETFPALVFDHHPLGYEIPEISDTFSIALPLDVVRPDDINDLAYYTIPQLAALIQSGQVSSLELTQLSINRLKKYDTTLECVITLTEERALAQAKKADQEIANGNYRGLLHGIPYGTKDLMSVEGYKTTWGAMPYKNQMIDHTATVIKKLDDAGAILVAKLVSGALARGDVWYNGETKSPWDTLQGASGSSAGPGAAMSAGLVGFTLGTETLGSITSPSNRNGISGLRPTYGRVSRDGVMSLSWSMDKVGPMCRSAEDCAIVFDAIRGKDGLDATTQDVGFSYTPDVNINNLKVAYLAHEIHTDTTSAKENTARALLVLDSIGVQQDSIALPTDYPYDGFDVILRSEAAAMFDDMVRSGQVDLMVQQSHRSRANSLRQARFIPAVEYLQANRFRRLLIEEINDLFEHYDVIISPTFGGKQLLITNLTGHPVVTVPTGFDEEGHPTSITFIGNLYDEASILAMAHAYQQVTDYHLRIPPGFE